jgi:hypothetical protein
MKSLLFQAMVAENVPAWQNFLKDAQKVSLPLGAEQLAASLWLLPADDETYLALSRISHRHGIASRCLTISHVGEWQPLSSVP